MLETNEAEVMMRKAMGLGATERVALKRAAGRVLREAVPLPCIKSRYFRAAADEFEPIADLETHTRFDGVQFSGNRTSFDDGAGQRHLFQL